MTDANDEALLGTLLAALVPVPGIAAIALGGSRARGTATPSSDYDIGLYCRAGQPIDVTALGRVAVALDDRGTAASVTPIGGWGPWIDGGGWLVVRGIHVDLLYRNLDRVEAAIDDAHAGTVERYYQPGHPHAFLPMIYMGEVAYARVLHDPAGGLARLQARTAPYPDALATALRTRFEWEATFALENARKSLERADVSYLAGCVFRSIACLCQVLFALNGVYLLNEKGAVTAVDGFARRPVDFARRVTGLYADLGGGAHATALDRLGTLIGEAGDLWPP
ncbi:MAG: nucleotidyltransferase domain-containing protein [Reyranellaceae bacterium]